VVVAVKAADVPHCPAVIVRQARSLRYLASAATEATTRAMYGALDLAESIRSGTLAANHSHHLPHIARRGIKFNAPLDVRKPQGRDREAAECRPG